MDPSVAVLTNAGMGYRPLAQGYTPTRVFGTQGLPFTGGQYGGITAMAMGGPLHRMMGDVGMVPMGVGHDQNVYDRMMRQRYTMMQMQAMQQAAQADRDAYMQTFRGLAAVTGTPFGGEQRRAAQSLANAATTMSPLFAEMMPDFLDQLGGLRGSNTVMARRMIDAGRYRMDPVTGRMGMSAESVGAISNRLYGDLYSPENLPAMRGVTAGQVGSMIQELQMRGMIGTAAAQGRYMGISGADPRAGVYRAMDELGRTADGRTALGSAARNTGVDLTRPGGLRAEDLDRLQLDPAIADRLRSFDATKIKRSVQSYVGVVSAMRDIFGDMGKQNAPMAELIAGIEALTMGGMSQIDPGRMSMMVRQTYNLAKQTGVTMDNVVMMQNHAAQRAGQMGIEPGFAVQAAQGALAFGGAYRAQGHGAHAAWGAMNADQVTQLDTNLRVQAAASNTANRMAVAVRMAEARGGLDPNGDAGRFVTAVRGGMTEFRGADGNLRSVMMSDREFTRMMTAAGGRDGRQGGISEGDVQTMLGQLDTNREYVERYGMANTVRRLQGTDELHPFVGHRMQETLTARFRDQLVRRGMDPGRASARAREAAAGIAQRTTRRMFDMGTEEFADTAARNQAIGGFIGEELDAAGMGDVLEGMGAEERGEFLRGTADRFYGAANRAIRGSRYRSFGNLQNVHRLTNRTTLDESDRQQMQARFTAEMQEALAPLGHGSMLQRAVEAVRGARTDDPNVLMSVVAESLGGVRIDDINRALMPRFQAINARRTALEGIQADILRTTDPQQRAALMERLDVARRELTAQASGLSRTGEQFGLFAGESLTHQDLVRAMGSTRGLMNAQNDIIGLRGNFGAEVSGQSLAAFRAGLGGAADPNNPLIGPLTQGDRMAVVVDIRNRDLAAIRRHLAGVPGATLSDGQRAQLAQFSAMAAGTPQGATLNDHARNLMAADLMAANITNVPPGDLAHVTDDFIRTNDVAARAVIRGRRQALPLRASPGAVDQLLRENPQLTREEAEDIANTRMRAARLGVDRPAGNLNPYDEVAAIAGAFDARSGHMFEVSADDINALVTAPGYRAPTPQEIQQFRDANPTQTAGKTDPEVNHEMHRRRVFTHKRGQAAERFRSFWGTNEGAAFREQTDMAAEDVENVASRLISSPQMVQRLGTRAVEMSDTFRGDQQRLRELAMFHTGGDLSRLMARDFTSVRANSPEEASGIVRRLNEEITAIQYRQRSMMAELMGQEGAPGRRFQLGDEGTFRRQVLDEHIRAGNLTPEAAARMMGGASPGQALQIEQMRRHLGSEEEVRRRLGIDPTTRQLSDLQRIGVAAVRFGAGSEEEARLMYGQDRWDALNATQRETVLRQMQGGVGTDEAAMALLAITPDQLRADGPNGDLAKRVRAVRGGLMSDQHATDVIGANGSRLSVREVRLGLFNPQLARERLGIPADEMPGNLQAQVEERRERWGNEEEAYRLMGLRRGQTMTAEQTAQHTRLSADVAMARRVRPEDEGALVGYETRTDRMRRMASDRGISHEALEHFGDTFLLTGDQRSRMEAARRTFRTHDTAINNLNANAANLRSQIAALGDATDGATGRQREALQRRLDAITGQITTHTRGRGEAEASVADDARARGVSGADYLRGRGWIDEEGLRHFRSVQAERALDATKIADIARGLGVRPEELSGATGVTRRLMDAQRAAAARANASPLDITRDIMREYGLDPGSAPTAAQTSFAQLLTGTQGVGMGRRILDTQRELVATAARRVGGARGVAGVDQLSAAYTAAQRGGATALADFRRQYGLGQDEDFGRFEQAMQFQQQTGLLSFGQGGNRRGEMADLARLYSTAMGNGTMRPGQNGGQNQSQVPTRMEMSGTVTLVGDQLDLAGAWGGGRAYSVPQQ
jgi:hypothetical protein